ncbi:unnamed protein product [Protopolystoma xenopodis]|uniref:Uncharacterized protein n=1 Tax=Protopolystoma xenopodis TaxID=117903 RepID=A0A448WSG5_9PLAT|nr:unnamed protein product [Protopolystoma xenopodis]
MGRGRWSVEGGEVVAAATPLLGSRKAGEKCLAKDFRFKSFFFPLFTTCRPPSSCNTWSLSATAVASRVCSTSPRPVRRPESLSCASPFECVTSLRRLARRVGHFGSIRSRLVSSFPFEGVNRSQSLDVEPRNLSLPTPCSIVFHRLYEHVRVIPMRPSVPPILAKNTL